MFLSSVLQDALTSIMSLVLDAVTLALREWQLPAAHLRPALTLLRLLACSHHHSSSPLLLQLQLVAGLQGQTRANSFQAVAEAAIMHKHAILWEQLSSGAFPAVLRTALERQVAPLAPGQLAQVVLEISDGDGLHSLRDRWQDSITLLRQNLLGIAEHLQSAAASVLRECFLPHGQVPVRQRQAVVLPTTLTPPSEDELKVILGIVLHGLLLWP